MKRMLYALLLLSAAWTPIFVQDSTSELARILLDKGVITSSELETIQSAEGEQRLRLLASMLEFKGLLTSAEIARLQVNATNQVPTASASIVPAVYASALPANVSALQQAPAGRPEAIAAPPAVTSQTRVPVTVYGTILLNAFFDTSLNNLEDIPLFAGKQGSDPFPNDKSFAMTARQSRLGLHYQGPDIMGAKLSGQVEVDFFGGKAALGNGINMDLLRLRLALGRLDWTNFSLVAGQDWGGLWSL